MVHEQKLKKRLDQKGECWTWNQRLRGSILTNFVTVLSVSRSKASDANFGITGRERLIQTQLIQSSTEFEVSLKFLQESYHFMFKNNG